MTFYMYVKVSVKLYNIGFLTHSVLAALIHLIYLKGRISELWSSYRNGM